MIAERSFPEEIRERGWMQFRQCLAPGRVAELNEGLREAYENCRSIQISNGVDVNTDGTVHHLLGQHPAFLRLIEELPLYSEMQSFFGAPYILNSYGGVINMPRKGSYVCNIHRDIRTFYHMPMMLNMLIMLDDFTLSNGATWLLSGSHLREERPDEAFFYEKAERAKGAAGDIVLFDSLLWHAAGRNETDAVRRALTLTFTRPFMKQQLDYPRLIGYERASEFSEEARQVIGYNARVPANLHEWYQPPARRFYRPGQG